MDPQSAAAIARSAHVDQIDRFGDRVFDHVARVAATVPPDARAVAWLHDVLERTDTPVEALRRAGLSRTEESALELITRRPGEAYEMYALRLAFAPGAPGRLARIVKRADLDDHIAHTATDLDAPPYAWARRHIANAQWRNHESEPIAIAS